MGIGVCCGPGDGVDVPGGGVSVTVGVPLQAESALDNSIPTMATTILNNKIEICLFEFILAPIVWRLCC
jgi:hypothetical protein